MEGLAGELLGGELAEAGVETGRPWLDGALLLPRLEGPGLVDIPRVLNPLNHLRHGHEVHVIVGLQDLVHPVEEGVQELRVILQPGRVEEEAEGGAVLVVVAVEVVRQEVVELVAAEDVRAGVDHCASGKVLVNGRIFTTIKLVHDHLPDGMGSGGALLEIAVANVGHPEVHGVWPKGRVLEGSGDGGVVKEGLLLHHGELVVAAHTKVGSTQSYDRVVRDVGELVDDQPGAGHLLGPVVDGGVGPEGLVVVVRDGVGGDLVTLIVHLLNGRVVGVLVRHEEGGLDVTAVGVLALTVEDLAVQVDVVVVDGVVEGDGDHLGDVLAVGARGADVAQLAGDLGSVLGTEAVGQFANIVVTRGRPVRIGVDIYGKSSITTEAETTR